MSRTLTEEELKKLVDERVGGLLSLVDMNKVATHDKAKGIIYIGGERPDDARLQNLKSEAEFLLQSDLWSILYESPKQLAQKAMFVDSESLDDLKKGKSMLYLLDTQKKILEIFKNFVKK